MSSNAEDLVLDQFSTTLWATPTDYYGPLDVDVSSLFPVHDREIDQISSNYNREREVLPKLAARILELSEGVQTVRYANHYLVQSVGTIGCSNFAVCSVDIPTDERGHVNEPHPDIQLFRLVEPATLEPATPETVQMREEQRLRNLHNHDEGQRKFDNWRGGANRNRTMFLSNEDIEPSITELRRRIDEALQTADDTTRMDADFWYSCYQPEMPAFWRLENLFAVCEALGIDALGFVEESTRGLNDAAMQQIVDRILGHRKKL